jgi:hypothetical protein
MTSISHTDGVERLAALDASHAAALIRLGEQDASGRLAAVLASDVALLLRRAETLRAGGAPVATIAERDLALADTLMELAASGRSERPAGLLEAEVAFLRDRAAILVGNAAEAI